MWLILFYLIDSHFTQNLAFTKGPQKLGSFILHSSVVSPFLQVSFAKYFHFYTFIFLAFVLSFPVLWLMIYLGHVIAFAIMASYLFLFLPSLSTLRFFLCTTSLITSKCVVYISVLCRETCCEVLSPRKVK